MTPECDKCLHEDTPNNPELYPYFDGEKIICSECLLENGVYVDSNGRCQNCPSHCLTCVSDSECLKCKADNHYLGLDLYTCLDYCPQMTYIDETKSKCLNCDSSCNF